MLYLEQKLWWNFMVSETKIWAYFLIKLSSFWTIDLLILQLCKLILNNKFIYLS